MKSKQWCETTLEKLLGTSGSIKTGPFGTLLKASEYSVEGVPVISVGEVGYGKLQLRKDTPRVSAETTSRLSEYVLETGDIIFGRKGAVDRSAFVRSAENGWFLGSDGIRVRLPKNVNSLFAAYQFQLPSLKSWLLQHASGSTMLSLNQGTLGRVPIRVPDLATQDAIANVLGALDDKIACNAKLIDSVDALAETQFHAALHGAQSKPLSGFAEFVNGKAFTKGASGTGRVVVRIAELNSGIGNSTVFSDAEVDDKHVARPGDILFAWSGSLTLHRWFRDEAIVNQHIFKVIPTTETHDWLIYELLRNKLNEFKMIAANKATTMGHIQRKHLDEPVLVPNDHSQEKIAPVMDSLWRTALNAERENQTLATTRDALLPQLMSGNLKVKNAEALVESVV